jgi:hypothetical protein
LRGIYPGAFVSDVSAAQPEPLSDRQVLRTLEQGGADGNKSVETRSRSANRAPLPLQQPGTVVSKLREVGDEQYGVSRPTPERRPRGTFKETLEILGTIELDVGREEEINGSGMQDLRIELQKESPLKQISRRLSLWTRKL